MSATQGISDRVYQAVRVQANLDEYKGEEEREALISNPSYTLDTIFQLSTQETIQCAVIADRWSFSSSTVIFNLFGVDLYNQIRALTPFVEKSALDEILSSFAVAFFSAYQTYDIDKNHSYFPSKNILNSMQISTKLQALSNQINKAIKQAHLTKKCLITIRGASQGRVSKSLFQLDQLFTKATAVAAKIHDATALFLKIFQHQESRLLMNSSFPFKESKDIKKSLQDIVIFLNYCHTLLDSNEKKGGLVFSPPPFFQNALDLLLRVNPTTIESDPDQIREIKRFLHRSFYTIGEQLCFGENEVREAYSNRLNYESWSKKYNLKVKKTHSEVTQALLARYTQWASIDFLLSQFENMLDHQLILSHFPCFSPVSETRARFLNCLEDPPLVIPEHLLIDQPFCCPIDFNQIFCEIIAPIESLLEPLLQGQRFRDATSISYLEELSNVSERERNGWWLSLLNEFPLSKRGLLSSVKDALALVPTQLLQRIQTQFESANVAITQQEKEEIVDYIQKVCFQQSLFLARMVIIMEDFDTFFCGEFCLEYKHLPAELVHVMELSGVEECIKTIEELPPPILVEERGVVVAPPQPIIAHAAIVRVQPPALPAMPPRPANLAGGLRLLSKTQHIIRLLQQHQFYKVRTKGSHMIFKGPDGRIVPVPNHKSQPVGTLRNIIKLATAPSQTP